MTLNILKVFIPAIISFFVGIAITPFFSGLFYKYKMWKKNPRTLSTTNSEFHRIHNGEEEVKTPRIGGMIIWVSVALVTAIFFLISKFFDSPLTEKFNFLSYNQTIVPLATLLIGAFIGLIDDFLQIFHKEGNAGKDATHYRYIKIGSVALVAFVISLWFYFKLETGIHVPFDGEVMLGIFFIPFFILVTLALFSTSVIDGMDGLSGGVLTTVFGALTAICFFQDQIDLAALSAVITGAILAFLWFNIPPARFYMGETGMIALTVTISVIAFLSDSVLLLPLIALPLAATTFSVIVQLASKKFRGGKRVFRVAPLHHHFEALGWPRAKVTMRYWITGIISAVLGTILALIS